MQQKLTFHIISMATYGKGLSGGDRIWIELAKILGNMYPVFIYLWEEGEEIALREGLKNVNFVLWSSKRWAKFGFLINYFTRIFLSFSKALSLRIENSPQIIIYSASEFWQDTIPALILKLRFSKARWIAAWYQTAPNPFRGYSEKGKIRYPLKAFLYWFVQMLIKPMLKFADCILVNNENERQNFFIHNKKNKVFVMLGAVDLERIKSFRMKNKNIRKIYDGVFQGRFHPQKGVVELIDIWKQVMQFKPDAKLAMIGDGPLMNDVKRKIKKNRLEDNIKLFGYVFDGPDKYNIFSQSKVVVHPSFYDSGGMASAEAIAFGLPCVGFNLAAYKSYYPGGMIKVKLGDLNEFAKQILLLLTNKNLYQKTAKEGTLMIKSNWSWDQRINSLLGFLET